MTDAPDETAFHRAIELLDAGDAQGLRAHLIDHPEIARQRIDYPGHDYFRNPTLLQFVAENPVRNDRLPSNIVEVAKVILDAGGASDRPSLDGTLALVCSGRVPRECGVQRPLIELLCNRGADPNAAMLPALGHGEFEAVAELIRQGAAVDLATAAATGRTDEAATLLPASDANARHRALALAAQHGHARIVELLLDAGEDPNRYNPEYLHAHSVPLHQAVAGGHDDVVRLLVQRGARLDLRDTVYQGTPLDWAEHCGQIAIAEFLRSRGAP